MTQESRKLAESIRIACIEAALAAYEDAGIQGLCAEGRWEAAVEAIRRLDLESLARDHDPVVSSATMVIDGDADRS